MSGGTAEADELSDGQWMDVVNKKKKDNTAKCSQLQEITINKVMARRLWGDTFKLDEVQPGNQMKLRNAKRGNIAHYGQRDIVLEAEGEESMLTGMVFQAGDVRRLLAAVHRIVEKGNRVQFGPGDDDFILNVKTAKKIMLRKKGRSYVMDMEFAKQAGEHLFNSSPETET